MNRERAESPPQATAPAGESGAGAPDVSVVVVSYNGARWIERCLRSVSEHVPVPHEILVVDNGSTDGTAEAAQAPGIAVVVERSPRNLGFAGGNNRGAALARGRYLLLLNQDAWLASDLAPALALLDRRPDVGVVGARMQGPGGEYRLSAGHFPSPARLLRFSSLYERSGPFRSGAFPTGGPECYPVDWVEGSFLLTRSALWRDVGGLDEGYFMYGEDVDYCRKALDRAQATAYCPAVSYVHVGGFSGSRIDRLAFGFRRYHRKFSPAATRRLANAVLDLGLLGRALGYGSLSLAGNPRLQATAGASWRALRGADA